MTFWLLTACLFMEDPGLNKCYDFKTAYESKAVCINAGKFLEEKYMKSETITGVAIKCEPFELKYVLRKKK